ncbi:tape measure protein [Arthrobacter phage Snek]
MSNVGYATLTVIPTARGFASALAGQIDAPLAGAGKAGGTKAGGSFVGAFKGLVGPAIALAGAGLFSGFVAEAARASDATDKFKATMSFAGLNTSAIDAATKAAKGYADQTVYDLPTIQNMIAQLASNGVKDYTGLTKAAGNLNAVAGGNAETFKSVAMVMTQTAGAGKLTTENWNQLSDAIPGAAGPLMKAMQEAGAYTGNFRDAMAEGEITSEEFNAALMKLGTKPVAVEAAKSTKTFEGAIGNLQATINSGLMGALDTMKGGITGAINATATGLGKLFGWLGQTKGAITAFGAAWKANDGDVTSSGMAGVFERIANAVRPLWDAIQPLIPQVVALWQNFSPLGIAFRALQPVLPVLSAALTSLAQTISGVLGVALTYLAPLIQTITGILAGVFMAAMPGVTAIVTILGNTFRTLTPVLMNVLNAVMPLVFALLNDLGPVLTSLVSSIMPPVVSIFGSVAASIGPLISIIVGVLVPVIRALLPVVSVVFRTIASLIQSAMRVIQGVIQVVTGIIRGNWSAVWSGIRNIASGIWSGITSLIGGAIRAVSSIIGSVMGGIRGAWSGAWNGLVGLLRGAWSNITSGVSSGISGVMGWIGGLWGRISGAVSGIPGRMLGVGRDMIAGLANGILGAAGMIRDAVARAIGNVVDFAKELLGIHSPSRVFMEIGGFTAEGMAIGIEKGAKDVQDAAKSLVPSVAPFRTPEVIAGGVQGAIAATAAYAGRREPATIHQENHFNTPMSEEAYAELAARKLLRAGVGR